jgi:hypothetical protein
VSVGTLLSFDMSMDNIHPNEHLLNLARTMRENWWNFQQKHGADERAWQMHGETELEEMRNQITSWIKECQDELDVRPSSEGINNIADDWIHSLTFKNEIIKKLIDGKS